MVSAVHTADGFNVSGSWKVEKEIHLAAFSLGAQNLTFERGVDHLIWDFLPKPLVIEFFPGIKQCKVFFLFTTVEALLTDTLVSGKLFLRPPSQKPDYFNSHTNSVFLHSRKRPAPVTDTFFASGGCPLTTASTVPLYASKDFFYFSVEIFFYQVFPCKNCFPPKSVCRIFFTYVSHLHPHPPDRQKSNGQPLTLIRGYTTPVHQ